MKHRHHGFIALGSAIIMALFVTGCELGTNPLLFDGSPVSANFHLNTTGTFFSGTKTVPLNGIVSNSDVAIDSISVINVSLLIDSLVGTPDTTMISVTGGIDGRILVTLTNVRLSTFTSERSIFDPTLSSAGVAYSPVGIAYLNGLLKHPESLPASVTVAVAGTASRSGLDFKVHLKLYTQIFTGP